MMVKGLKLITGEELLVRWNNDQGDSHKYTFTKPMLLIPKQVGNQYTIGLIPWIMSADEHTTFEIGADKVIALFTPIIEVEQEFLRQTTGIQLVTG
jgi:hypothetical protein